MDPSTTLTGLPDRRAWDEQIQRLIADARDHEQPLMVALLDLDDFKRYDEHGRRHVRRPHPAALAQHHDWARRAR